MPASQRIALLVATAALVVAPANALAQNGAGDDQYTDPFATGNTSTQSSPKSGSGTKTSGSGSSSGTATTTPAPSSTATTSPSPTAAAPVAGTAPAGTSSGQLPRTGSDVWLPALGGLALLAVGLVLLRRRGGHAAR